MKCQEVMMYMQRQLDGDLAPNEEDELHAHLMHCLDCAQMFERLQALSNELSQLPKVTPPFSLVDAIMPQLLELDKQAVTPKMDNVVAFSPPVTNTVSNEAQKSSGKSRFKDQFSWKFASGVVAAGLIIGFFAFNMQKPLLDNADGLLPKSRNDSKSVQEMRSTAASDMNQMQGGNEPAAKAHESTSNQALPNVPNGDALTNVTPNPGDASVGSGLMPKSTSSATLEKPGVYSSPPVSGGQSLERQTSPSTSAPAKLGEAGTSSSKSEEDTPKMEVSPPAGLSVPQSSLEPKSTDTPNRKNAPGPTEDPSSADRTMGIQGSLTLSPMMPDTRLKSASGLYEATIEDAHVVIRNSHTLEIVFASKQIWQVDDQIKLLEWAKDDKLFYEVVSKGTLQTILIDVNAKTESNQ